MRKVEAKIHIDRTPEDVLQAFIDPEHLKGWWGVERALVEPHSGGAYIIAWQISEHGMRYVHTGVVRRYQPGRLLHLDHWAYLNPEKPFLGGMELIFRVTKSKTGTLLQVKQDGYRDGEVWNWYYEAVLKAWPMALESLKKYLSA